MKTLRWVLVGAALALSSACSGGSSHSAAVVPNGTPAVPATVASAAPTTTMSITIERSPVTTSATKRKAQTIPSTALSVDARIYSGSTTSGTVLATACVAFPSSATSATLSFNAPQGMETLQIASWSQGCTGSGGNGTTGQGSLLSSFVGTGTVLPTSTDIGVVFNNGTAISLVTPLGGTGTILTGPLTHTESNSTYEWGPPDVAATFNYPVQSGFDGTGMTVAIVIDSAVAAGDLSAYLSYFQIPSTSRTITYESVDGASTTTVTSDGSEATLDLETIAGLAPGANIIVYVIPSLSDNYIADAYNQIISDGHANIVNSSFGGCEGYDMSSIFANGTSTSHNVTFVASSGDQGSTCYSGGNPEYVTGVNYPASDPNVIGVGGTAANPGTDPLNNPAVWNDDEEFHLTGNYGAGGGGVSTTYTRPPYQSGLAGAASTTFRNVPDLALPATVTAIYETNNGWSGWCTSGGSCGIDGTSWAAPEYVAQLAGIYQYCKTTFANPVSLIYTEYALSGGPAAFIDVTSGDNHYVPVSGSPTYAAGTGYDNASGFGIPLGMPYAEKICPNRVPLVSTPVVQAATVGPPQALVITPRTSFLTLGTDLGARAGADTTNVQFVLRNTAGAASNEQAVTAALQSAGFTITQLFSNHLVVDATAPTATVQSFLGTQVHNVDQGARGMHSAPVTSFTIPPSIAPYVSSATIGDLIRYAVPPLNHR